MPAAPVHHTAIDKTNPWDGPAAVKAFDKKAGDFVKFYAWVDEGESDADADGTDKEDGWGPHHDVDDQGVPGDANVKGVEAAMAALNGAHGGTSVIPDADCQGVWDHLAAHYRDAGTDDKDIPPLEKRSALPPSEFRDADPGSLAQAVDAALDEAANLLDGVDVTTLPAEVQQALSLVGAAGETVDNLLVAMNVNDPDEDTGPDDEEEPMDDDPTRSRVRRSTDSLPAPRENLIRSRIGSGIELRDIVDGDPTATGGTGSLMFGHFSVFNDWYEIDSFWEGTFLESIAPGAFQQTMVDDLANMRVLYDHGFDPELGNKVLGPITALREDDIGAYYEVPLLDTAYNRDFILPALQGRLMSGQQIGSQLGASFRFIVLEEQWTQKPDPSDFNLLGIPQRLITRAQVLEFGPVTFPASPGASSGVRSQTDRLFDRLHNDPRFVARFTQRVGSKVVERMLEAMPVDHRRRQEPTAQPAKHSPDRQSTRSHSQRKALVALHNV